MSKRFGTVLVAAAAVAVIAYLCMDGYAPIGGVVGNAMHGFIMLPFGCSVPSPPPGYTLDAKCGTEIPYRWILIALVLLVTGSALWERR